MSTSTKKSKNLKPIDPDKKVFPKSRKIAKLTENHILDTYYVNRRYTGD